MPDPELSIIIPTYNEKENISILIPLIKDKFKDIDHEILVVDDNSPDGTAETVLKMIEEKKYCLRLLQRERKEGLGAALRAGYNEARGKFIASTDADLSFRVEDLKHLYEEILKGYDFVTGDFHAAKDLYKTPTLRVKIKHWFSLNGNRIIRAATGIPLGTFSANFRIIKKSVWRIITTEEKTNSMLFEMIAKVWQSGGLVSGIPARFEDRKWGQSKMRIGSEAPKYLLKLFSQLIRCRRETARRIKIKR